MDKHLRVLSLGVAVDKEEEEEVKEVVPSLDPMLGARVTALAKLLTCSFWCGYLFMGALSLKVNVRHAVLPRRKFLKLYFLFFTHQLILDICLIVHNYKVNLLMNVAICGVLLLDLVAT